MQSYTDRPYLSEDFIWFQSHVRHVRRISIIVSDKSDSLSDKNMKKSLTHPKTYEACDIQL